MELRRGVIEIIVHLACPQLLESTLFFWLYTWRGGNRWNPTLHIPIQSIHTDLLACLQSWVPCVQKQSQLAYQMHSDCPGSAFNKKILWNSPILLCSKYTAVADLTPEEQTSWKPSRSRPTEHSQDSNVHRPLLYSPFLRSQPERPWLPSIFF